MVAFNVLPPDGRAVFREALSPDESTWTRARGCALSAAVVIIPYYRHSNPGIVRDAMYAIEAVLSDDG